jgi:SNF2 family DNA or RNA helicase
MDSDKLLETIERLRQVRTKEDLRAPASSILRGEMDGGRPLTLRNYQVQGILHLLAMPRFVLGDDTGLGKTLQTIAALSYLWDKRPEIPAIICTTKSAVGQWESEFSRFTMGVQVFKVLGTKVKRAKVYEAYKSATGPKALILGYRTLWTSMRCKLCRVM